MRSTFLFAILLMIGFGSCKKKEGQLRDFACKCDNGQTYVIKDSAPGQATGLCDQYDNICPPGEQCIANWDCSLD